MIEDLEGATSEPPRRRHVVVLSGAVASISLVLLVALVMPAPDSATPQPAASPTASVIAGRRVTIVSGADDRFGVVRFPPPSPLPEMRLEVRRVSECVDGRRFEPPYYLVIDGNGQVMAAYSSYSSERTGRSAPKLPDVYVGTGSLTVSCATSDVFAPRVDVRSIAR